MKPLTCPTCGAARPGAKPKLRGSAHAALVEALQEREDWLAAREEPLPKRLTNAALAARFKVSARTVARYRARLDAQRR